MAKRKRTFRRKTRKAGKRRKWTKKRKSLPSKKYMGKRIAPARRTLKPFDATTKGLVNFGRELYPRLALVHLSYWDYINLTEPTVAPVSYVEYQFRINSLFDPDLSSTGHQPRGYDQLCTIYTGYIVLGLKYEIELVMNSDLDSSVASMNFVHGLVAATGDYPSQFSSAQSFMETPQSKYVQHRFTALAGTAASSSTSQYSGGQLPGGMAYKNSMRYTGYIDQRNLMKYWATPTNSGGTASASLDWPDSQFAQSGGSPSITNTLTFVMASLAQGTGTGGIGETNNFGYSSLIVRFRYDAIMTGNIYPAGS